MDPRVATAFVNVERWLAEHPSCPPHVEMGAEFHVELTSWGFNVALEVCERAAQAHLAEGKEAAAEVLRAAGVPVKTEPEVWQGCKFSRWTVKGKVLMCG